MVRRKRRNNAGAAGVLLLFSLLLTAGLFPSLGEDELAPGGWLGVSVQEHEETGILLLSIVPRSPADLAGLRIGDRVVAVSGVTGCDVACLGARLTSVPPGTVMAMRVVRNGSEREFSVTVGVVPRERLEPVKLSMDWEFAPEEALIAPEILVDERLKRFSLVVPDAPAREIWFTSPEQRFGADLIAITPELRRHLGGPGRDGMLVGGVDPDSPAGKAGILAGDLIVELDGSPVAGKQQVLLLLASRSSAEIQVALVRAGKPQALTVRMPGVLGWSGREALQRALVELEKSLIEQEMSRELRQSLEIIREELDRVAPDSP